MGDQTSANNSWVESYLEALLSYGLSTEYSAKPQSEGEDKVDADRDLYAKYYVNQILGMGEEGIRDAWHKATSTRHYTEQDARLEHLAWRTWWMKMNRDRVSQSERRRLQKQYSIDLEHDVVDNESGDDDLSTPKAAAKPILESVGESAEESAAAEDAAAAEAAATAAESSDAVADLPQGGATAQDASTSRAERTLSKRTDSIVIGSMAPINAEDMNASGDLDWKFGRSLRIDTRPTASVDALVDPGMIPRQENDQPADPFEGRVEGLYIVLISLHGLVRGNAMELGKDADTGGQVKYVVELARAISLHPAVHRVELLTRLIQDPKVSEDYGQPEEVLRKDEEEDGELGGAYIVRLPCGDSKDYLRKEKLWPHTREFADRAIAHTRNMLKKLQEVGEPCSLYTVHGHYADAGEVAAMVASTMASTEDVDMVMTGHSLGRNKLEHLLASGTMSKAEIEQTYKIGRRIEGEERALDHASMVFTSTQQEVAEQWGLYDGYDMKLEKALRYRKRTGRHMPIMNVIPPGLDFSNLKVDLPEDPNLKDFTGSKPAFASRSGTPRSGTPRGSGSPRTAFSNRGDDGVIEEAAKEAGMVPAAPASPGAAGGDMDGKSPKGVKLSPLAGKGLVHSNSSVAMQFHMAEKMEENPHIWQEISRFLRHPRRPAILAMSRPDAKKNITTLVKAYGSNPLLRQFANLVLVMGNRDNIDSMAQGSQKVLNQVLRLIDLYDLYGSVAYPKAHSQQDISDIYRFPLVTKGVFVNPALQEPFGLTVIEAAAHGVPTVATKNGGPVDIMKTLHHGVVVDPTNEKELGDALLNILTHPTTWSEMSRSGIKNIHAYSWLAHSRKYLESVEQEKRHLKSAKSPLFHRTSSDELHLCTALDAIARVCHRLEANHVFHHEQKTARASGTWDHHTLGLKDRRPSNAKEEAAAAAAEQDTHVAEEMLNVGDDVRGTTRDAFIIINLDGQHRAGEVAATLKQAAEAKSGASGNVGLGIVALNSFEEVSSWLKAAGANVNDLDWVVCNGGADIRHISRDGSTWEADEAWEQHIDWRWDRSSLGKLLAKVTVAEGNTGETRTPLLANLNSPQVDGAAGAHPHHLVMELDDKARKALGSKGSGLPPTTILDRLRKRLRMNAYRCHLTLQMVPGKAGWLTRAPLQSCIHVTPLRSSRSLAIRFLGHRFGVPLDRCVILVPAPSASPEEGDKLIVGSQSSDLQELIGGQPWVVVRIPATPDATADESKLAGADKVAIEKMQVRLSRKMFGARVQWADASDAAPLQQLLRNLPNSDGEGTQGTGQE